MPHPNLLPIFTHIDAQRQLLIDRLIDYVRRPSISAHGLGMAEVAAFLVDQMTSLGFATELIPPAGGPMAGHFSDIATFKGKPGTNICHQFDFARGDAETALAAADMVVETPTRFPASSTTRWSRTAPSPNGKTRPT